MQKKLSYGSIRNSQISIDCSVLKNYVFVLCAYFDGSMVFIWWVFAIEKLEYSRYNKKQNNNWFDTAFIVVIYFLTLMDLTKVLLSFVWLKLSSFWVIWRWKKEGCKSLSLGMPRHPKILSKNEQPTTQRSSVFYSKLYFYSSHDMCFAWSVLYDMSLCLFYFVF